MATTIRTSLLTRNSALFICVGIVLASSVSGIKGQEKSDGGKSEQQWSESSDERDSRIKVARQGQYRYIFFSGKFGIRDHELRKRLRPGFNDGDVFHLEALKESTRRLSRFKKIYPVTLDNIVVRLDDKHKWVDFAVKIEERRKE